MTICNSIGQQQQPLFYGTNSCCQTTTKPQQSIFNNNTYTNNFNYNTYNRITNINQTFNNYENTNLSIKNDITVNNYNQYFNNSGLKTIKPGFTQRIGWQNQGCGCQTYKPQTSCGKQYGNYFQPFQKVWSSFTDKIRNFMNTRYTSLNV